MSLRIHSAVRLSCGELEACCRVDLSAAGGDEESRERFAEQLIARECKIREFPLPWLLILLVELSQGVQLFLFLNAF